MASLNVAVGVTPTALPDDLSSGVVVVTLGGVVSVLGGAAETGLANAEAVAAAAMATSSIFFFFTETLPRK